MKTTASTSKRILVVDDEPGICNVCVRVLTGEGFKVDIAVDGKDAQDRLWRKGKDYDLCLLDVRMPLVDGSEFHQWLKQKHPEMANRVIFITGDVMSGDTESLLEASGRPFLSKPFDIDWLKTVVKEALQQAEK